jgi:hypothetical protein
VSVVQALALAQLGMGVPDGSIEPLQQEIEANRIYTATVVSVRWCAKHEGSSCGCNVSSLPIMVKGEQFLRVIGIFPLYVATIKLAYNENNP